MTTDEISKVHSSHKRARLDDIKIKKKEDFEINQDDDDDDDEFVGPKIELFQKEDDDDDK